MKTASERLAKKLFVDVVTGCFLWTGYRDKDGYGLITVLGKTQYAHRLAYELAYGAIPRKMCVCHKCDIPACVNPQHLFVGSYAENTKDMDTKGRRNSPKGELHARSVLSVGDVVSIRKDARPFREIAKDYSIWPSHVSRIKRRLTWAHLC